MDFIPIHGCSSDNLLRHPHARKKNFTGFEVSKRVKNIGSGEGKKNKIKIKIKKRKSDIPPNLYRNRIFQRNIQMESVLGEEV